MRRRVFVERETCETAGDMATNLAAGDVEPPPPRTFPYSNWGPWAAVLGVVLALGVGIVIGIPALVLGQQRGTVERFEAPAYSDPVEVADAEAAAVAVDPGSGNLYVDEGTSVSVFGSSGRQLGAAFPSFGDSLGIAVDGRQRIYVSDREAGTVSVFRRAGASARLVSELDAGALPAGDAADFEPAQLAIDTSTGRNRGDVYVIDRGGDSVYRFSASGAYLGRLDAGATPAGSFDFSGRANANGIAVGGGDGRGAGTVYVVAENEDEAGTVWAFDESGRFLWEMPGRDGEDVCGVAVDREGRLWVADSGGGASQYAPARRPGQLPVPTGRTAASGDRGCAPALDRAGNLFVAQEFEGDLTTGGNVGVQLATALSLLLVPMALASWRGATSLREILEQLGVRRFRRSALKWMAASVGAYLLFAMLYSVLILPPEQEDIAEGFGALPVQILLIAILAPISEEVCFRGMLFGGLRERLPRVLAALAAGMVFGALHALTGLSAVPPLIAFGFILCLLYEKTGSIVPGILLHALNNSVALLAQ